MVGQAFAMLHDDLRLNPSNPKVHIKFFTVVHIWVLTVLCSVQGGVTETEESQKSPGQHGLVKMEQASKQTDKKTKQKK